MATTLQPTPGFILIAKLDSSDDFFTSPDPKGNLRQGIVVEAGADIIHTSGKSLPAPVKKGERVVFQYIENQDITFNGTQGYLVPFNLISGHYA